MSSAQFHRTWGIIGVAAGVVFSGAGATWLVLNAKKKSDANNAFNAQLALYQPGQLCDPAGAGPHSDCDAQLTDLASKVDSAKSKDLPGWIGVGVGGALAVTGVVLLLTGDDPSRYDKKTSNDVLGKLVPSGFTTTKGGGFALSGVFLAAGDHHGPHVRSDALTRPCCHAIATCFASMGAICAPESSRHPGG